VQTPPWTAERIELLQKLWAEGETAASIAARLGGISRSAVLGKVFRLRLPVAGRKPASPGGQAGAEIDCASRILAPTRRRSARRKQETPPPASRPRRQHKTLLELINNSCRWPHGRPGTNKFFFCGAPEADFARGIPYCGRHMLRAYGPDACVMKANAETQAPVAGRPAASPAGQPDMPTDPLFGPVTAAQVPENQNQP